MTKPTVYPHRREPIQQGSTVTRYEVDSLTTTDDRFANWLAQPPSWNPDAAPRPIHATPDIQLLAVVGESLHRYALWSDWKLTKAPGPDEIASIDTGTLSKDAVRLLTLAGRTASRSHPAPVQLLAHLAAVEEESTMANPPGERIVGATGWQKTCARQLTRRTLRLTDGSHATLYMVEEEGAALIGGEGDYWHTTWWTTDQAEAEALLRGEDAQG